MSAYRRKVRYWDVDANGHVFNTRYLVYVDDALTDFLDAAGSGFQDHEADGFLMVLVRTEIDYRREATIGDELVTKIRLKSIGNTSLTFGFEIMEDQSGRTVADGNEIYVTIDAITRRPITVPVILRDQLNS